jgi:uncharacterized protein
MCKSLFLALICLALVSVAGAQDLNFPEKAVAEPSELSKVMPALAQQVLTLYKEDDRDKYLDNLFRLQIVAGQYGKALDTTAALRQRLRDKHQTRAAWVNVQYEIYVRAKMKEDSDKLPFNDAYAQSFHDAFGQLDDRTSSLVIRGLTAIDPSDTQQDLQSDLEKQKGKSAISLADALKLVRDHQVEEAYRVFATLNPTLIAEDDRRRYIIEKDIMVKTPDGATVCAFVVRPRPASQRLPALLNFTIYVDPNDNLNNARMTAANGYAGVEGFTRGKACSPDKPVPYEHDGPDAAALIDWISTQPWSDGRVGMYGGSYEGFCSGPQQSRCPGR